MRNLILVSLFCLIGAVSAFPQTNGQIILSKKHYYVDDKQLNGKDIKALLKSETESSVILKKSTDNTTIGLVFAAVGTGLCIYAALNPPSEKKGPLPGLIDDAEMRKHLTPLLIGAGCVLVGVPFLVYGNSLLKKSVTVYNSKHSTGCNYPIKINLGVTLNGVGLVCRF